MNQSECESYRSVLTYEDVVLSQCNDEYLCVYFGH